MLSYTTSLSTTKVHLPRPVPTTAQSDSSQHPTCFCAELIDGAVGHPFWYGCLSSPDVYPYGVEPHGFHCLHYQGVLPFSACPTFHRNPGGLSCCTVVETPTGLWASPSSPSRSCFYTRATTAPPPYTSLHRTASMLPSFPAPSLTLPTASDFPQVLVYWWPIIFIVGNCPA